MLIAYSRSTSTLVDIPVATETAFCFTSAALHFMHAQLCGHYVVGMKHPLHTLQAFQSATSVEANQQ